MHGALLHPRVGGQLGDAPLVFTRGEAVEKIQRARDGTKMIVSSRRFLHARLSTPGGRPCRGPTHPRPRPVVCRSRSGAAGLRRHDSMRLFWPGERSVSTSSTPFCIMERATDHPAL